MTNTIFKGELAMIQWRIVQNEIDALEKNVSLLKDLLADVARKEEENKRELTLLLETNVLSLGKKQKEKDFFAKELQTQLEIAGNSE